MTVCYVDLFYVFWLSPPSPPPPLFPTPLSTPTTQLGQFIFRWAKNACRKVKHVGLDVRGKRKEETTFWNLSFCHQTNLQRGITQQWKAENLNRKKTLKKRENNTWPRMWPKFIEICIVWACFALLEPSINTHVLSFYRLCQKSCEEPMVLTQIIFTVRFKARLPILMP